ncbi:hypothetical protein OPIT5_20745 [Opitutaceae bacterium TAV5]|nr:hypothetical protein OPIT5_20745 [Opitutaceae bacterium TAV5]
MLTVVAIIGVLAGILIPVASKVRQTARVTQCASNLRQWAQAITLFANDNKGYYVTKYKGADKTVSWDAASNEIDNHPYVRYLSGTQVQQNFRTCPAEKNAIDKPVSYALARPRIGSGKANEQAIPFYMHPAPSQFLLMLDRDSSAGTKVFSSLDDLAENVKPLFSSPKDRHGSGINAAFGDGHVSRIKWDDIEKNADRWTSLD